MHNEQDVLHAVRLLMSLGYGNLSVTVAKCNIEEVRVEFSTRNTKDLHRLSCKTIATPLGGHA